MLIELYRMPLKFKRWYLRIFGYIIDLSVVNAWLLYKRESGKKKPSLKLFRTSIAEAFLVANVTTKRGRSFGGSKEESRYSYTGARR
ncbi:hypothetical protein ILUMI_23787, partial [Ignelater luminosus]